MHTQPWLAQDLPEPNYCVNKVVFVDHISEGLRSNPEHGYSKMRRDFNALLHGVPKDTNMGEILNAAYNLQRPVGSLV